MMGGMGQEEKTVFQGHQEKEGGKERMEWKERKETLETVESTLLGSEETQDQVVGTDLLVCQDFLVEWERMVQMETMVHQDGQDHSEIQDPQEIQETMSLVPKDSKVKLAFPVLLVILVSSTLSTLLKAGPFEAHAEIVPTKMATKASLARLDYLDSQAFKEPKESLVEEDRRETLVIREEE